ncbi:MAG: tyrosine-protein phosphatase [Acetivibrionales bacterium]|jgi:protein-tyrosine phosphatase
MVDIHSHIIFGVDDGPPSLKESIRMVLEAERLGIKKIIATPHFHWDVFNAERARENFKELKERTSDCGIEIFMGYEVFINPALSSFANKKNPVTLADSRYMLFELPLDAVPVYSYEAIYKLHLESIVPVLAHPERNRSFVKSFNSFLGFLEKGCLVQLDAASIVGVYGMDVKRLAKKMIKMNMVHFIASDAHCWEDFTSWYLQAYRKVYKWAGEEYADRVFNINPGRILSGDGVEAL